MKTPLLLLISLTTLCTASGDEGIKTYRLYGAIGSSVFFPEVKIDKDTVYDLTGAGGDLMVTCHDACSVRNPYTKRGHFYQQNGTFQLTDLRMEDNGTYEYKMNLTVKGRIHLWMIAPVTEAVFFKQERRENDSQCLVTFTCHAKGEGPFNFTSLRNNKMILHTVHSADNSSSFSMDGWDPATSGMFSCNVANPASSQTSPAIELPIPATPEQTVLVFTVIGLLIQWGVALPFFLLQIHKPSACWNSKLFTLIAAFAVADDLFGFLKESVAVYISVKGGFIPGWCCVLPAFFLLCRTMHWIIFLVNSCKACEKRLKISFVIRIFCEWVTYVSVFFIFVFCVAILGIFDKNYYCPCGMMYTWQFYSYIVLIAYLVLVFYILCYIIIGKVNAKRRQLQIDLEYTKGGLPAAQPSQVPNGGIGQPDDNQIPNYEQPVPDVVVDNTNGDQEEPQQQANCENLTEEGSEDQTPKPKRKENTEETKDKSANLLDEVKVLIGDLGQPGDCRNPNSVGHSSDRVVSYLNVDRERSEQGQVFTEGGSENQAPKSEEGQLQVPKEDPKTQRGLDSYSCKSQVRSPPAPDHEDSDGTENTEGQCLLTMEREVGAHDKDRVANG